MSDNTNIGTLVVPHDTNAEKAVIGAILKNGDILGEVEGIVKPSDFYSKQLGVIYEAMLELNDRKMAIDLVTVNSHLKEKGVPEEVTSIEFIKSILESVPISANAKEYAEIVKAFSLRRGIISAGQNMMNMGYNATGDVNSLMDDVERDMMTILSGRSIGETTSIRDVVIEALEKINAASQSKGHITGVPSGFYDLDYKTSGFQNSDLILVAARPSMGKTAFVLNIAHHVAIKERIPVAIFSLEMSKGQLVNRILAQDAMVSLQVLRTGELKADEWNRLSESANTVARSGIVIDDTSAISIRALRTKCRKYKIENNIGMIIIDYLQLMTGNSKNGRQQEISEISRSLKSLARELDIPVIALSQLSREVEKREDKKPMLSDLRESGAIEQDADVVMFIYREDYYKKDTERKNVSDIIIAKQRNGPVGSIELAWLPEYTKFGNLEKRRD